MYAEADNASLEIIITTIYTMNSKLLNQQNPAPVLLSICIPTFNRAESLNLLLGNISRECTPFLEKIEIVISDNASTDHTASVVKSYSHLPIRYSKNKTNIGGAGNLLSITAEIATGEFVWVIGDDDLILPNGLANVLESITNNPTIDYHYINFGWIKASRRDEILKNNNFEILKILRTSYQCDLKESKILNKLEDLAFIPGYNPSALFCCIFSFACRRQFFIDAYAWIKPTYSTDGTSITLDDWYPHAMASVTPALGKPIAYIGAPCILQSIGSWEWKEYLSKSQIFGVYELLKFFENKGFDKKCLNSLWQSYYKMAGRIFPLMQLHPTEHKGIDIVLKNSIPKSASKKTFWEAFMLSTKANLSIIEESEVLAKQLKAYLTKNVDAKIGLWGVQGRGYRLIKDNPKLRKHIVWVTDKAEELQGDIVDELQIKISQPSDIIKINLDCLVIGTQKKHVKSIIKETSALLHRDIHYISL